MNKPKNENYAAVVVEIKTLLPLANCDNVQAAIIMGNQVIVDKRVQAGAIGLYFPLETQLSEPYLKANNLYRKPELNADQTQKGYFEENGRIRCVKFRGNKSEGLFMPLESLNFIQRVQYGLNDLKDNFKVNNTVGTIGDTFDEVESIEICRKYIIKHSHTPGLPGSKKDKQSKKYKSKLVENQFRFHQDTSMLYKNIHRINPDSLISITYKVHGTSGISSYILCKEHVSTREKIGLFFYNLWLKVITLGKQKASLVDTDYDYLYASRKVIKNEELNPNAEHFYDSNIWELAHNELKDFLQKGMTFYYEVVGYMPSNTMIQKDYDYGCEPGTHKIYIYRITYTNTDGKVFEFSAKQVQDFCKKNGLNAVPQLYYGYANNFLTNMGIKYHLWSDEDNLNLWRNDLLNGIKEQYNEKDCYICKTKVPEEGVVIRIEENDFEAYKAKSNAFYERETKLLDKGESNIEDEN